MKRKGSVTLISTSCSIAAIGIRLLSSFLKNSKYHVKIIFLPISPDNDAVYSDNVISDIVDICKNDHLIGISLMTNDYLKTKDLTQKLKKHINIPVLWGGIHPTVKPEDCLNDVDLVCVGEGEEALLELLNKLVSKQSISDIQNIWYKDKVTGRIYRNSVRPLEENLDKYPDQDYSCEDHFILDENRVIPLTIQLLEKFMPGYGGIR